MIHTLLSAPRHENFITFGLVTETISFINDKGKVVSFSFYDLRRTEIKIPLAFWGKAPDACVIFHTTHGSNIAKGDRSQILLIQGWCDLFGTLLRNCREGSLFLQASPAQEFMFFPLRSSSK